MKSTATANPTMTCEECEIKCQRFGKHRNGLVRFRCPQCGRTYTEPHKAALEGSYISMETIVLVLRLLVEGNSLRSTQRISGLDINTIMKLLVKSADRCEKLMGRLIVNVPVRDVECDEIWAFVRKKEAHVRPAEQHDETIGDQYCFIGIERHTKLVLNFALGRRSKATCDIFIEGLRQATRGDFQITTDGFGPYVNSISDTLADRVSFAQLIKVYRAGTGEEHRYSPPEVASVEVVPVLGNPDPERICTSIVERQNLTVRMSMRRLTRLTNGFSKKWENLWAAYCLHFAYYNFCRIHKSLRVTPAMEAGITDHVWDIAELLA